MPMSMPMPKLPLQAPVLLLSSLVILLSTKSSVQVGANWIDPDTPLDVYTTRPRPIPLPKPKSSSSNSRSGSSSTHGNDKSSNSTKTSRGKHDHTPTPGPTFEPTIEPTPSPSATPTSEEYASSGNYHLIMSDEFNIDGRSFADGHDPKWTALDKNDYTNDALHYYSPDNVITKDGDMIITTEAKHTTFVGLNDTTLKDTISTKNFKSAMIQSWNKFCFTGGIVEAEIQIPGKAEVGGLWPAFWLLGNMARHTYVGSTNHVWPWSSNVCTPYSADAQRISGCMKAQHYGLEGSTGRGAPEIDIFEVQAGNIKANTGMFLESSVGQPFMSASYQVAPGRPNNRPGGGWWPGPGQWYEGLTGGVNTSLNIFFYGDYNHFRGDSEIKDYWSDAVSYNHQLQDTHFERKHKYRVEWELPEDGDEDGVGKHDGYIRWFVDDRFVLQINGTGIVDAGLGSTVSTEPMYIIMNTAVSSQWGFPKKCPSNCNCKKYDCLSKKFLETCGFQPGFCDMMTNKTNPPEYKISYVRVYQNINDPKQKVGCSTPERPTSKYIEAHQDMYKTKNDRVPLKPIQKGKGKCIRKSSNGAAVNADTSSASDVSADSCGGPTRGLCNADRVCICRSGWTGPHCLVPTGFNPVQYDRKDGFEDLDFTWPQFSVSGLTVGLGFMGLLVLFAPTMRRRMDNWKPL